MLFIIPVQCAVCNEIDGSSVLPGWISGTSGDLWWRYRGWESSVDAYAVVVQLLGRLGPYGSTVVESAGDAWQFGHHIGG